MSEETQNSDSFDIDWNAPNEGESQEKSENSVNLDDPFGNGIEVSEDNVLLNEFSPDVSKEQPSEANASESSLIDAEEDKVDQKKNGLWGGLFGRKKAKTAKETNTKEKPVKPKKEKKEKIVKEKESSSEPVPRDWGTVLCIIFSVFLLVSLLTFNVAALFSRDANSTIMGTLCFLGAFNLIGLTLVAVPVLFYKFPKERTLPNVLLGVSAAAMFTGVLLLVSNFYYYYGFAISP